MFWGSLNRFFFRMTHQMRVSYHKLRLKYWFLSGLERKRGAFASSTPFAIVPQWTLWTMFLFFFVWKWELKNVALLCAILNAFVITLERLSKENGQKEAIWDDFLCWRWGDGGGRDFVKLATSTGRATERENKAVFNLLFGTHSRHCSWHSMVICKTG